MPTITLKGSPVHTHADLPAPGTVAPDAWLCASDLKDLLLSSYKGSVLVLNIVPSVDTGICAASTRRFNQEATALPGVRILTISADLPFAGKRFCAAEGIDRVEVLSTFRSPDFGQAYGTRMIDGPMKDLQSRAVLILDKDFRVVYREQVPEIAQEPDYAAALAALQGLGS